MMEGQPIMQQDYQPTPEQLEKRMAAEALMGEVRSGERTTVEDVDPRKVSIEALQEARYAIEKRRKLAGAVIERVNGRGVVTI